MKVGPNTRRRGVLLSARLIVSTRDAAAIGAIVSHARHLESEAPGVARIVQQLAAVAEALDGDVDACLDERGAAYASTRAALDGTSPPGAAGSASSTGEG